WSAMRSPTVMLVRSSEMPAFTGSAARATPPVASDATMTSAAIAALTRGSSQLSPTALSRALGPRVEEGHKRRHEGSVGEELQAVDLQSPESAAALEPATARGVGVRLAQRAVRCVDVRAL